MDWKPTVLVIGPGGVKGYYEIGVLKYLTEKNILIGVKEYVGVSIGSIIALLMCVGFSMKDIIHKFMSTDILSLFQPEKSRNISIHLSIFNSKPIRDLLSDCMKEKLGFVPTLKQLYMVTNKTFVAVTLNLSLQVVEYINWNTEPTMSVIDAVALSINIPGVFQKIKYRGNLYVDGALGNPYPVDAYDNGNTDILGIAVLTKLDVDSSPISYIASNIDCPMYHLQKNHQRNASNMVKHIVFDIDTVILNPTSSDKINMIKIGFNQAEMFYHQLNDTIDSDPHMIIKSTFLIDDIEVTPDTEEIHVKELPTINELLQEAMHNSSDTNKLIDVLHGILEYARFEDGDNNLLADIIQNIPLIAEKTSDI